MGTQEYVKATAKIAGPKLPIIVVPGIMGSRLTDPATHDLVWNPTGATPSEPGSFAAKTARIQNIGAPLIADETHKFAQVADRVRVDPVNHYYNLITAFYGDLCLALHYDLGKRLAAKGFTPAVYCCGYDWRQDNDQAAHRLSEIVDEARADCDNAQVVLVAHSMGGLVSRHYCRNLGGESKVRALFLLGSPSLGAVDSYAKMRNGMDALDSIRRVLNLSRDDTRALMRSMQSVYQLLPNWVYCSAVRKDWAKFDAKQTGYSAIAESGAPDQVSAMMFSDVSNNALFYLDIYTGLRDDPPTRSAVSTQLGQAFSFHTGISVDSTAYMPPTTAIYYGTGQTTPGSVNIVFQEQTVSGNVRTVVSHADVSTVDGDQTVPQDSANCGPVSSVPVERRGFAGVKHTAMSGDKNVLTAIQDRLVAMV